MMSTQVNFKIDKKLKDSALKKARREGTTLSAVLKSATHAFVQGNISVGLKTRAEEEKDIDEAIRVFKKEKAEGKLLSIKSLADLN